LEDLPSGIVERVASWWKPEDVIDSYERAKGLKG